MKKFIPVIMTILFLTACTPEKIANKYLATWYVKNTLEYPIMISKGGDAKAQIVLPKDSLSILSFHTAAYTGEPPFNILYYNDYWERLDEKDQHMDILSEKGDVLKAWYYMEKQESGRQFFDEIYWKSYKKGHSGTTPDYNWVFEITPEDIAPIEGE